MDNLAIGALHLAGRTDITRRECRDMTRPFTDFGLI
jgi:hypothetical protein